MTTQLSGKKQKLFFERLPIVIVLILVFLIPYVSKYFFGSPIENLENSQKQLEQNIEDISTKINLSIETGDVETGYIEDGYLIDIISDTLDFSDYSNGEYKNPNFFPKVYIGDGEITYAELRFNIDFNDWYKKNYKKLIYGQTSDGKSARYVYALKYFIGNFDNGGYVNVYRTATNAVDNLVDDGLFGAYLGKEILGGKDFVIPLNIVKVAREQGNVGYTIKKPLEDLIQNKGKELYIGGWLSDREGTFINSMQIYYEGDAGVIQLVE